MMTIFADTQKFYSFWMVLHAISDVIIGISFLFISVTFFWFVSKQRFRFRSLAFVFGLFLTFCGLTQILDIWSLWNSSYIESGLLRMAGALASIAIALWFFFLRRQFSEMLASAGMLEERKAELERKNRELQVANTRILESEKVKNEFLTAISHELRTPLTLILAPSETLLDHKLGTEWDEKKHTLVRKIHNNSIRLLQMITGLLDHARLETSRFESKTDYFDAIQLTKNLVNEFRPSTEHRGLAIIFNSELANLKVCMDRYIYERVLYNLISNALKFTPAGGTVTVKLFIRANDLCVEVVDTGIGIPAGLTSTIFDKFRQLSSSSVRRFEGVGLGLALVKEFMDLLNGSIEVESQPGCGSTFRVYFPYAPSNVESLSTNSVPISIISKHFEKPLDVFETDKNKNDLPLMVLAENNQELADYISDVLSGTCRVRIASNGDEALHMMFSEPPDLLLCDVVIPVISGFELCKRVKVDERTATIPVLLLTALTGREDLIKGWEAGADDYLHKPFHPEELVTRVKTLIALYRVRQNRENALKKASIEEGQKKERLETTVTGGNLSAKTASNGSERVWDLLKGRDEIVQAAVRNLRQMDVMEIQIIADKLELALVSNQKGIENRNKLKPRSPMEA